MSSTAGAVAALGPTVVAIFICAHQLTLHGVLHGVVISGESQNLASAIALSHGAMPYSSFPLAQPPGMLVLLLPLGLLTHVSAESSVIVLARVLTAVAAVACVYLAGLVARPYGLPASILAGVFTATYPLGFLSTAGVTVGPWILLFTLVAAALAFDHTGELASTGRLVAAGVLLGFACTIKPWALVPTVAYLGCIFFRTHRDAKAFWRPFLGVGLGIAVPCVPFFLDAPGAFWHDVVVAELPGHGHIATGTKLAEVLGLSGGAGLRHPGGTAVFITAVVIAVVGLTAAFGWASSTVYDAWLTITAIGAIVVVLFPGTMSAQYGGFAFPLLAVVVGVTASRLVGVVAASWTGSPSDIRGILAPLLAFFIVACALIVTAVTSAADGHYAATYTARHAIVPRPVVDATVPAGVCAVSNNAMLLIASNRYIGGSACPAVPDTPGLAAIAGSKGSTTAEWESWLGSASYAVFTTRRQAPRFVGQLGDFFRAHYALAGTRPGWTIYVKSR